MSETTSSSVLSIEHVLEQFSNSGCSVWKRGLLIECEGMMEQLKFEFPNFNKYVWRIVRIEKHLVKSNSVIDRKE